MASKEHMEMANFIKSVHKFLRDNTLTKAQEAWKEHCNDEETLQKYAECMKGLATGPWSEKGSSRIAWTVSCISDYFHGGLMLRRRQKEENLLERINETGVYMKPLPPGLRLEMLDVGSCYNPFAGFDSLNVTAIDIAPSVPDVIKCDFLHGKQQRPDLFVDSAYHIVVFCLYLEYLPLPEYRHQSCALAYDLLQPEGILVIITPDSNHVGSNAKLMKAWKLTLAALGFSRVRYEKTPHLHCMCFRKALSLAIPHAWDLKGQESSVCTDKIFIPQDIKTEQT